MIGRSGPWIRPGSRPRSRPGSLRRAPGPTGGRSSAAATRHGPRRWSRRRRRRPPAGRRARRPGAWPARSRRSRAWDAGRPRRRRGQVLVQVDEGRAGNVPGVVELTARRPAQPPAHVEQRQAGRARGPPVPRRPPRCGARRRGLTGEQPASSGAVMTEVSGLIGHRPSMPDAARPVTRARGAPGRGQPGWRGNRAAGASIGTSCSAGVSEPCMPIEGGLERLGLRCDDRPRAGARGDHVADAGGHGVADRALGRAEQAVLDGLLAGHHPGALAEHLPPGREHVVGGTWPGVHVPDPRLAAEQRHAVAQRRALGVGVDPVVRPDVHHAVVGRHVHAPSRRAGPRRSARRACPRARAR